MICKSLPLLAVDFSTGVSAVLLGAAAIILIVMIVEAVGAIRAHKTKAKEEPCDFCIDKKPEKEPAEIPAESAAEEPPVPVPPEEPPEEKRVLAEGERLVYDKSFSARLILSGEDIKRRYSALKNELLKSGFQSRICWRYESFRAEKPLVAKLAVRACGLCLFCALDPESYPQAKDVSVKKSYKRTPLSCAVDGESGERVSRRLIADLAQKFPAENPSYEECDYSALLPFEDMEKLIDEGLVKVKIYRRKPRVKREKIQTEKRGKTPPAPIEKAVKKRYKKGVKRAINLEVIYACFNEGEEATFEEIINRVFGGKKNITFVKILGRGSADKKLVVTANSFSRSAEKSIVGAGGKIIRKNS